MRIHAIVSIVPLLLPLPAALSAQRFPPMVDRRPGTDLPPQPPAIANDLDYRRWHLSFESYPVVSYIDAPGFAGVRTAPSWTTLGFGTRADYLVNRNVSATLDLTSSFIGGPVMFNTAELGTRLHSEWAEHKLYPYVDLRVGFIATNSRQLAGTGQSYVDPVQGDYGPQYSRGYGVIGGTGLEYSLTRTWSLTTGASVLTSAMRSHELSGPNADRSFTLTAFRYMIGLRYNPVTIVRSGDAR